MAGGKPKFRLTDVVSVAIRLEESATETYSQAAKQSERSDTREALLGLAEMEEKHRQLFAGLLASLGARGTAVASSEMADYLEAWLDGGLFPASGKGPELGSSAGEVEGWIATAVAMEKDAIAFYSGLREMVPGRELGMLDGIIAEELGHLVVLSSLARRLARA